MIGFCILSCNKPKILSNESKFDNFDHDLTIRKELVEHLDAKVKCVEEFFLDNPDLAYQPADSHSLEQSPCVPIIDSKVEASIIWFNCKLHPGIVNINLSSIEHHCKYSTPELHKSEILNILNERTKEQSDR